MKHLATIILLTTFALTTEAQTADKAAVEQAGLNYLEGFYEGDTIKLKQGISPDLYKYGYWKGKDGHYAGEPMTYREAIDFAKGVFEKKHFARKDAPKKVEILDMQEYVACIKVTAWWGIDYALLSKKDGDWRIEQVLWQGPYNTIQ